jgi:iron complex outermembrane recepter protein
MIKLTRLSASLSLFAGTLLSAGVLAQSQETPQLERVIVTGSNIKRSDTETASPVQVLTRDDIEKTGKQSIQEVLRGVTADGQGSIPTSFTAGFASGSASVSLRGLGVNSTLVLINGRRMTTYGLADDGARTFVDLNTIPLEAVERIEVLKDGASAIYGADAVGGVVNLILRKTYNGGSIGGSYGQTGHSDGQTTRAFGTLGFGNLDSDKYNVFVSLEASQQKHIMSTDRGFIGADDLTQFGFYDTTNGAPRPWIGAGPSANSPYGVIRANPDNASGARLNLSPCPVVGSNGLCRFNTKEFLEVQPAIDRLNLFGRGTLQFSPTLQAYVEIGLFNTKSKSIGLLGANNDGGIYNPSTPDAPVLVHPRMNLPAGHPDNPLGADRLLGLRPFDFGGRNRNTDSQVTRLVEGLQGSAFGWDYDFGAAYIASRLKDHQTGFIRYNVMQDALNNGTYRVNNPSLAAPGVLAAISPTLEETPTSSVKLIDFKATRDLMALKGGPLGLALGAEYRWENASTPPVPFTSTGEIVGLGYSTFSAKRKVGALYGEVTAPVAKWLELSVAVRSDQYSDFGNSTTPKLGFKLMPMDQLAVRGTYAEAFRAPGPAERGGSTFGFTTVGILTFGNPDLKPEKSKSYTLGLIFEPASGTSATLDFYNVDRKNEIVAADTASILYSGVPLTGTPLSKIPGAAPNSFIYYNDQGQLSTVSGQYQNATSTKTNGADLELRHKMSLGEAGKLSAQMNWTHVNKFQRTDVNGNTFEYAGTHGPIVLSAGAGTPKDRASMALTWDRGPYAVTTVMNYVGGVKLIDHKGERATQNIDPDTGLPDGTVTDNTNGLIYADGGNLDCSVFNTNGSPSNNCRLPSFTTFDLFAKWTPIKNLDINFSIQNLFDRKAPFDPYLALPYAINYNQTWHQAGAVGRFFSIGAKYSF